MNDRLYTLVVGGVALIIATFMLYWCAPNAFRAAALGNSSHFRSPLAVNTGAFQTALRGASQEVPMTSMWRTSTRWRTNTASGKAIEKACTFGFREGCRQAVCSRHDDDVIIVYNEVCASKRFIKRFIKRSEQTLSISDCALDHEQ